MIQRQLPADFSNLGWAVRKPVNTKTTEDKKLADYRSKKLFTYKCCLLLLFCAV